MCSTIIFVFAINIKDDIAEINGNAFRSNQVSRIAKNGSVMMTSAFKRLRLLNNGLLLIITKEVWRLLHYLFKSNLEI